VRGQHRCLPAAADAFREPRHARDGAAMVGAPAFRFERDIEAFDTPPELLWLE
jgi:hypothetical protein